jgi:hypothetical protein
MRSWQTEKRHLTCRWSEVGQRVQCNPRWMQEASDIQSGYLSPVPDFASHSPFGGATSWFQLHTAERIPSRLWMQKQRSNKTAQTNDHIS